jgi:hypothetical protein
MADTLTLRTLVAVASVLEIRLDLDARWRGGDLGRLLNAAHSAMHERIAGRFARLPGWLVKPEVSFAIYGERGVIDLLAFHPRSRALLVVELKTELVDVQALLGTIDRYQRLARRIASERGWQAMTVSCWVVMRDTMTNRRRVTAHATVLRAAIPDGGRDLSAWLREPAGTVHALSFLSDGHRRNRRDRSVGSRRVRSPTGVADHAQQVRLAGTAGR